MARVPDVSRDLKEAVGENADLTNRNRIRGLHGGVTRHWTGRPDGHSDTHEGKPGKTRGKESRLTLGGLVRCPGDPDYRCGNTAGKTREKSAEAVAGQCRRITRLRHSPERGETGERVMASVTKFLDRYAALPHIEGNPGYAEYLPWCGRTGAARHLLLDFGLLTVERPPLRPF